MNRFHFQILAFTLTRTVLNTMHRMVYPFLAVFGRGLGVDLGMLSLAVTARSAVGALGPFLASVADSHGRKTGMLSGLFLFTLGVGLVVIWPVFPAFVLALILTILGKYAFDPSMQAYLGDRVPYQRRGLVMAFTEIGWSLAFIAGIPLMSVLIARWGWSGPFPLLALAGVGATGLIFWLVPNDPPKVEKSTGLQHNLRSIVHSLPALAGLSLGACISASNEVVNLVFGIWMEDAFGMKIVALGAASAVIGLSELGGEGLTAAFADRLGKPRAVGLGILANCLAAVALPVIGKSLPGAVVGLFFFYISFEFTIVSSIPMMTEILPLSRATLMATFVASHSLGRAVGALAAPGLYSFGILGSALAAVGFNLLALAALRSLRLRTKVTG